MSHISLKTHYEILGIERNATPSEIKTAYKEKLLATHPDKTKIIVSDDIITRIKTAYTVLSSDTLRNEYDKEISQNFKKNGVISTGDGLDVFSIDDFVCIETDEQALFKKDCPRCTGVDGFILDETDLEQSGTPDGAGGYEILVQCGACSLWLKVKYYDLQED